MLQPGDSPLLVETAALITPKLIDFGALLFGERIGWSIKEMWVNVLDKGGRQAMHNHANSFVSGVIYLTPTHPEARTVFMKSPGGIDFAFRNDHNQMTPSAFSADKWISPAADAGRPRAVSKLSDARRAAQSRSNGVSRMAFNAIPDPARLLGLQDHVRRLRASGRALHGSRRALSSN